MKKQEIKTIEDTKVYEGYKKGYNKGLEDLRHELDTYPEPHRGIVYKKINKLQKNNE